MPVKSLDEKDLVTARDAAVLTFSDWENKVKDGDTMKPGGTLHRLLLKDGHGHFKLQMSAITIVAAGAIGFGHEPDLTARSQQDPVVRTSRDQRSGPRTSSHVHEIALDRQVPQAPSGGNPDLLFRRRDGRRDNGVERSSDRLSAAPRAAF